MAEQTSQGSRLQIATSLAASKTITGITVADPPIVSSTAHGYTAGDMIVIESVVGMVEVNDRIFEVAATGLTSNAFGLLGVLASTFGYTAYASGGTAKKATMTTVGKVSNIVLPDPTRADIDKTNLQSTGKEYNSGIPDYGEVTFDYGVDPADTGQIAMMTALGLAAQKYFAVRIGTSGAYISTFAGCVKKFSQGTLSVDGQMKGSGAIRVSGPSVLA